MTDSPPSGDFDRASRMEEGQELAVPAIERLLCRNGALLQCVTSWDKTVEWNRRRRAINRDAVLSDYPRQGAT